MPTVERAAEVVDQLQAWIEDRDDLSAVPCAVLEYTKWTMTICINHECVWNDEDNRPDDGDLTLEWCQEQWLKYVESLNPFKAKEPA